MGRLKKSIAKIPLNYMIMISFIPFMMIALIVLGMIANKIAYGQIKKNANVSMNDTLSQTADYLDTRLNDVFNFFKALENSSDMLSLVIRMSGDDIGERGVGSRYYINLREALNDIFASYSGVLDSAIIDFNDSAFQMYYHESMLAGIRFDYEELYREREGLYTWKGLHKDSIFTVIYVGQEEDSQVASLYRLYGQPGSQAYGGLVFNIKNQFFKEVLTIPNISPNGYIGLIDGESMAVYKDIDHGFHLDSQAVGQISESDNISGGEIFASVGGERMVVYSKHLTVNGWTLVAAVPEIEMYGGSDYLKRSMLMAIVAAILVCAVISTVLSFIITKPIKRLAQSVSGINIEEEPVITVWGGIREIAILGDVIRNLLRRVQVLLHQVEEEQRLKREAELSLIQTQINPHFLYNTLYTIQQLCALRESREAEKMVLALANFFRIGISKGNDIIPLKEEIEHVRNYLVIQQMKYSNVMDYTIHLDDAVMDCPVLKLTLQPMVENSIYHGIKQKEQKGHIRITAKAEDDWVYLCVEDNGAGMTKERLQVVQDSIRDIDGKDQVSFGLKSVYIRLYIQYRGKIEFCIESIEGEGTKIDIKIPWDKV